MSNLNDASLKNTRILEREDDDRDIKKKKTGGNGDITAEILKELKAKTNIVNGDAQTPITNVNAGKNVQQNTKNVDFTTSSHKETKIFNQDDDTGVVCHKSRGSQSLAQNYG